MRKSFSIHSDYYGALGKLTDEQRGKVLMALMCWANDDTDFELDPMCDILFGLMTAQIERISSANSANGSKGGKAKKAEPSELSEAKRIKPSVTVPVTVPITVTETDNQDTGDSFSSAEPPKRNPQTLKAFADDSDEMKLSVLLFSHMRKNNPDCKEPNYQSWCRHVDLMIRVDKRTPKQIQDVIAFCQQDSFWWKNILSTEKLRKQFDALTGRMSENSNAPSSRQQAHHNPFLADFEEVARNAGFVGDETG